MAIEGRAGVIQQAPMPPQPQRTERLVWMLAAVALCAIMAAVLQGQRITDLRADMHAERASRERLQMWIDGESKAVRSYIVNGRLRPAAPMPPTQQESSP